MEGPAKPKLPDAYADLEVSPAASSAEIKTAFHRLALLHHPDKKAPGEAVDAADFRRIQEAYDILRDPKGKARYDQSYSSIRTQWDTYRREHAEYMRNPNAWRQKQSAERIRAQAESDRRAAAMRRAAQEQAWAEAEAFYEDEYEYGYDDDSDYEYYSGGYGPSFGGGRFGGGFEGFDSYDPEEILLAELLRRRENFEAAARRNAEERARKSAIEDINKQCIERLKKAAAARQAEGDGIRIVDPEKKRAMAQLWVISLQRDYDSELRKAGLRPDDDSVMDLGWERKKGRQTCLFCAAHVQEYSYRCPSGGAVACRGCKKKIEASSPIHPFNFHGTGVAPKKGKGKKGKGGKKPQTTKRHSDPEGSDSVERDQDEEQTNGEEAEQPHNAEEEAAKQAAEELARKEEAQRQKQERKAEASRRKAEREAQAKLAREAEEKAAQEKAAKEKAEAAKTARELAAAQEAARLVAEKKKEAREREAREKKAARKKATKERAALEKAAQKKVAEEKIADGHEVQELNASEQDAQKVQEVAEQEAKQKAEKEAKAKTKREARELAALEAKEREIREAEESAAHEAQVRAAQEAQERAEREAKEREAEVLAAQEANFRAELEAKETAEREAREMLERVARETVERVTRETIERVTKETVERLNREMAERDAKAAAEQQAEVFAEAGNANGYENVEQVLEPSSTNTPPVEPSVATDSAISKKTKKKATRPPATCYTCNEQGHFARDCPMKPVEATADNKPQPHASTGPAPKIEVTSKPPPPTPAPAKVVVKLPVPRKSKAKEVTNNTSPVTRETTAPFTNASTQQSAKPIRAPKKKALRPAPPEGQGVNSVPTLIDQPSILPPTNGTSNVSFSEQTSKPAKKPKVKGPLACYVCKEVGHKAKDCPAKSEGHMFNVVNYW